MDGPSERVLATLAEMVELIARDTARDAAMLSALAEQYRLMMRSDPGGTVPDPPAREGPAPVMGGAGAAAPTQLAATITSMARGTRARADDLEAITTKEAEERTPPGGTTAPTPGGGTGTPIGPTRPRTGGGGGSGVTPRPDGGGGEDGGGGQPRPPEPPVVVKKGRTTRRCYRFSLTNPAAGRPPKPVSDLHFDGGVPASVTAPEGWTATTGPDGFGFAADGPKGHVPPGRTLGPFEFCADRPLRGIRIRLTFPDGTDRPLAPGDVTVRGRPAPVDADGNARIPPSRRTYVYETTLRMRGDGSGIVRANDPAARIEVDGDDRRIGLTRDQPDGRRWEIDRREGDRVDAVLQQDDEVTVRVVSDDPHLRLQVGQGLGATTPLERW